MFREVAITQALNAPAAKVFAAFIDPVVLGRWFFPDNFTVEEGVIEGYAGGRFYARMKNAAGMPVEVSGKVLRVEQPHRLVFTWQWRAAEFGDELTTVDISIREEAQGCVLSIQHGPFDAAALSLHEAGWRAAVGRLPAALERSQLPSAQNPHKLLKRREKIPGNDAYEKLTIEFLNGLYLKRCPTCTTPLTKTISTRQAAIRCEKCQYQGSRLKGTPLQNFKLPLWMFGWCLSESIERYPKVLTASEIQRRLGVAKNTATLLKRRLQLFASEQLPKLKKLMYEEMQKELTEVNFPREDDKDLREIIKEKNIPQVDTCAIYSASQRANKGRKRYKNTGLTASIYMSDNLGGEQKGILTQVLSWKGGPVIYDSIPDNTANTLRPLLDKYIPKNIPFFSDEGYKFYYRINKNHRMINHSLKSKDKRYRFARDRWSKNGINTQVAEGHNSLLKRNFVAGYHYIKPKYSQLYLNEYAFWRNVKYYGWNALLPENNQGTRDGQLGNFFEERPAAKAAGTERGNERSGLSAKKFLSYMIRT